MTAIAVAWMLAVLCAGLLLICLVWRRAAHELHDVNKRMDEIMAQQNAAMQDQNNLIRDLLQVSDDMAQHLARPAPDLRPAIRRVNGTQSPWKVIEKGWMED